jgi:2-C-methyl-D-erythritol 2,4-cyclodiphosphate synthase
MFKVGIGQDSHNFDTPNKNKKLVLGGVEFDNSIPLKGNSDADVVLHSITNAISGITGVNIIGKISDEMCKNGIIDSKAYLTKSIEYLIDYKIVHLSISIECKIPKITPKIEEMKESIGALLNIENSAIGITATTGENLTEFGKGNGIQVFSIITAMKK